MSEYQYYEFRAIDRRLTGDEMEELRSHSSRAEITPRGFINEYNYGDLKADPAEWMQQYFDAFVHVTSWCNCLLALRVPHFLFGPADLEPFATNDALTFDHTDRHWIIYWSLNESEDYERFNIEEGVEWMERLSPLRDEIQRGDLRPLYLGWLAGVTFEEVDDTEIEPELPPGLAQLSAAQQALVEFLEIDADLLSAAARGSPAVRESGDDDMDAYLKGVSAHASRATLKLLLQGKAQEAESQFKSRFLAWRKENRPRIVVSSVRRSASELRELALEEEKLRAQREADERLRRDAEQRKRRDAYLKILAKDFNRCWSAIDEKAARGTARGYDEAKRALVDLADAYALTSSRTAFDQALQQFMARHGKRPALMRRLVDAGLWG